MKLFKIIFYKIIKLKKWTLSLILYSIFSTAFAEVKMPVKLWQPNTGVWSVTPAFVSNYTSFREKQKGVTCPPPPLTSPCPPPLTEFDGNNKGLSVTVEYGAVENLSLGLKISYLTGELNGNDLSGLENIEVFSRYYFPFQDLSIHTGILSSLSLVNSSTDDNGNSNQFTGGHSLEPYLSLQVPFFSFFTGITVKYRIFGNITTKVSGATTNTNGPDSSLQILGNIEYSRENFSIGIAGGSISNGFRLSDTAQNIPESGLKATLFSKIRLFNGDLLLEIDYQKYSFVLTETVGSLGWRFEI